MKEMASAPTTGAPFAVGQGMVAGASALGIGALAFYGLGFGNEAGAPMLSTPTCVPTLAVDH